MNHNGNREAIENAICQRETTLALNPFNPSVGKAIYPQIAALLSPKHPLCPDIVSTASAKQSPIMVSIPQKNTILMTDYLVTDYREPESLDTFVGVYHQTQNHFKELDKDIERLSTATEKILERDRQYWYSLGVLADMLYRRGRLTESHDDLALARSHIEDVIKASARTDENYDTFVSRLLMISCEIHKTQVHPRAAALDDIRSVVGELPESCLNLATDMEKMQIHDDQGKSFADQASRYEYRYNRQTGQDWVDDMRQSVTATRKALNTISSKDESYTNLMVIMGGRLFSLYRHDKNPAHLEEATKLLNNAHSRMPTNTKMQKTIMSNLARLEWAKWQADEKTEHLDNAIDLIRQSDSNKCLEVNFLWQRARATDSAEDLKSGCNLLFERIRDQNMGSLEAVNYARDAILLIETTNVKDWATEAMASWFLDWKKRCIVSAVNLLRAGSSLDD
ncbi:hypothetical protein FSST1_007116 [Fusarium sambucinum]